MTKDPLQDLMVDKLGKLAVANRARGLMSNQRTLDQSAADDRAWRAARLRLHETLGHKAFGNLWQSPTSNVPSEEESMQILIDSPTTIQQTSPSLLSKLAIIAIGIGFGVGAVALIMPYILSGDNLDKDTQYELRLELVE